MHVTVGSRFERNHLGLNSLQEIARATGERAHSSLSAAAHRRRIASQQTRRYDMDTHYAERKRLHARIQVNGVISLRQVIDHIFRRVASRGGRPSGLEVEAPANVTEVEIIDRQGDTIAAGVD